MASVSQPRIVLRSPDLYVDWERDKPHEIRWEAFDNATEAAVRIDLLQRRRTRPGGDRHDCRDNAGRRQFPVDAGEQQHRLRHVRAAHPGVVGRPAAGCRSRKRAVRGAGEHDDVLRKRRQLGE
ncbi:MAG: hypothetical protein R3C99_00715 [Pirellulaceae bacterium]